MTNIMRLQIVLEVATKINVMGFVRVVNNVSAVFKQRGQCRPVNPFKF